MRKPCAAADGGGFIGGSFMRVLIIDGQGGKIGASLIAALRDCNAQCEIVAVGTNTMASAAMMKAGADKSATGENPIVVMSARADIIAGPMGIIAANSLLGEITPRAALAVSESEAKKILIPMNKCHIAVAGIKELTISEYIECAVRMICELLESAGS